MNEKQPDVEKMIRAARRRVEKGYASKGLYTISLAEEYTLSHLAPALLSALGKEGVAKNRIGKAWGSFYRKATTYSHDGITTIEYSASGTRLRGEPTAYEVSISEAQIMSDAEVLAEWPILESTSLAHDLRTKFRSIYDKNYDEFLDDEDDDEDENNLMLQAEFAEIQAEALDMSGDVLMTGALFGDQVTKYCLKTLKFISGQRPTLEMNLGYIFKDDEYPIPFHDHNQIDANQDASNLVGDNVSELFVVKDLADSMLHEIEQTSLQEFKKALVVLGMVKKHK